MSDGPEAVPSAVSDRSNRKARGLIAATALLSVYLPSSTAGVISPFWGAVGLITTFVGLCALAARRGGLGHPVQVALATLAVLCLLIGTLVSPFSEISPGLIPIFGSLALIIAMRVHDVELRGTTAMALLLVLGVSLTFGSGLALNAAWADRLALSSYNAFYPALLGNMVTLFDKPVLTFATHSLAAYVIYLFVYLGYTAWRVRATWPRRIVTIWLMILLWRLDSTTSLALTIVAVVQVAVLLVSRHHWLFPSGVVVVTSASIVGFLLSDLTVVDVVQEAREALLGDRIRGLVSRYATGGVLASNFRYLSDHPLRPIGLGFTPDLYLGDSGVLLVLMRGSIPLLIAVYGGLFAFLHYNLRSRSVAAWLFVVTLAFEVGFTPLQYYRFLGLLPLLVVAFNGVLAERHETRRYTGAFVPPQDP